jgi:serine phosphatase RsbU (regulator of sigma subunit)
MPAQMQHARDLSQEAWKARATDMGRAYKLAREAYGICKDSDDTVLVAECRRTLAVSGLAMGLVAEAFDHATAARRLFNTLADRYNEAIVLNTLGAIYDYLGDLDNRLQCNLESLRLREEVGDNEGLIRSINNTGDTYIKLQRYDMALPLFRKALRMLGTERPQMQAIVHCNMGEALMLLGRSDEARTHLDESLRLGRESEFPNIIITDLILLARLSNSEGQGTEAIRLLNEALGLTDRNSQRNELAEVHECLAAAYEATGDMARALDHHKRFYRYQTEHLNERKIKEVRGMQFRQQIEELRHTTEQLEGTVSERTRQLEDALAELRIRDRETRELYEIERAVNEFSQSLFNQTTVGGVAWDLAKNCIARLGFHDCVIYLMDAEGRNLVQTAAHGQKNPMGYDISNPLTLPLGMGIVGSVGATGEYELIHDTTSDARYLVDEQARLSEIAVPILSKGKVLGVIDSEHAERAFFKEKHLRVLQTIASLVANRIESIRALDEQERLQAELIMQLRENEQLQTKVNRELEAKVAERTLEIELAKQKIEAQAKDITDSISYARSLQEAMLPTRAQLHAMFPDIFTLYLPREMVSGDFYWANERDGVQYLAVADCTGHGVPGALMSVMGIEKMEQALLVGGGPGNMLGHVNREVRKALRQSVALGAVRSHGGMDVALISYQPSTGTLRYAGAKRPLCLMNRGECVQVSATRHSIGSGTADDAVYHEHTFSIAPGDQVYLFTDGLADQFGGDDGRKFTSGRLRQMLHQNAHMPLPRQHRELLRTLHQWQGKEAQVDDILLVGIRF